MPTRRLLTVVLMAAAAVLTGCAADQSTEMIAPGSYALDCSGGAPTWERCYALATKACKGGGYEIESQVSNEGSQNVGTNDWSTAGSEITRTMIVKCK